MMIAFMSALLALAMAMPGTAQAEAAPELMQAEMTTYFHGERRGGYGFASTGAASLITGGLMLASSSDLYQGMSYPMLGLGAAELVVGSVVILSAGPRIERFTEAIRVRPGEYQAEELGRMQGVSRVFRLVLVSEVIIAAGGLGLGVYGTQADRDTMAGVGFGLAIQAVLLLGQDVLASRRAGRYTRALQNFQVALSPGQGGGRLTYGTTW